MSPPKVIKMRLDAKTLKQKLSIEEVIGTDHPLKQKSQRMWVGDSEDCNSLQVSTDKQLFSWWSRDWHGDVFTYLMESRSLDFRSAFEVALSFANECPDLPIAKAFKAYDTKPKPPINTDLVEKFERKLFESDKAIGYLLNRGLGTQEVKANRLGFEPNYNGTDIITIPVFEGPQVKTIRFRRMEDPTKGLVDAQGNKLAKYGYMFSGYGVQLYNADVLLGAPDTVYIVEGEFKTITLGAYGLTAVGIMGVSSMKTEWFERFKKVRRVIVALDPDQRPFEVKWVNRLAAVHGNVRVLQLPNKIDDMLIDGLSSLVARAADAARKVIPTDEEKPKRIV